jgi:uncharacterized Zn finger protein
VTEWFRFDCPDCSASFDVDETVRGELLAVGCVECGAAVTRSAFSPLPSPPGAAP